MWCGFNFNLLTASSDHGNHLTYILHSVYYLKGRGSRPTGFTILLSMLEKSFRSMAAGTTNRNSVTHAGPQRQRHMTQSEIMLSRGKNKSSHGPFLLACLPCLSVYCSTQQQTPER